VIAAANMCQAMIDDTINSMMMMMMLICVPVRPVSRRIKPPPPKNGDSPILSRKWNSAIGDRRHRNKLGYGG